MRRVHTEEKDGFTISYFDDPGLAPGMPFNPTTPQLKKTKRIWVKTNRSIFITTPESKADPVFKVPTQSVGKYPELKRKRKADDTEPTSTTDSGSSSAPLTKRQRTDCATTIGSISAVTKSSVRSGMSVTLNSLSRSSNGTTMKRKADEMDLTPEGASNDRRWTETQKVKKRCVDFSDMPEQSFVSNSSANHSWLDHSFQSVSDIFNLSSGNEMNATRDSFGIGDSFNNSYNGSFYDSFSHLAELI